MTGKKGYHLKNWVEFQSSRLDSYNNEVEAIGVLSAVKLFC